MPKSKRNDKSSDLGVLFSGSVVLTQWRGKTVASKKPVPKKRSGNSPKQQDRVDQFRSAHHYASTMLQSADMLALYTKGINAKRTSAHAVAFQDFLNPPVVHYIRVHDFHGRSGDVITVKATDDFRVQSVAITICDSSGKELERGAAERYQRKPFIWKYKITLDHPLSTGITIEATAADLAGNKTNMTVKVDAEGKVC